mmetsp:Transcript_10642/g.18902  ORF Transcript_10642/g.18902 Transcript_10642/m.18902 type:complete len:246 (-) Transcript_10642:273-1010(-)
MASDVGHLCRSRRTCKGWAATGQPRILGSRVRRVALSRFFVCPTIDQVSLVVHRPHISQGAPPPPSECTTPLPIQISPLPPPQRLERLEWSQPCVRLKAVLPGGGVRGPQSGWQYDRLCPQSPGLACADVPCVSRGTRIAGRLPTSSSTPAVVKIGPRRNEFHTQSTRRHTERRPENTHVVALLGGGRVDVLLLWFARNTGRRRRLHTVCMQRSTTTLPSGGPRGSRADHHGPAVTADHPQQLYL